MKLFSKGFFTLFKIKGVPVKAHWSALILLLFVTRLEFRPVVWIGFILLVFVHELGHAFFVKIFGARVLELQVNGIGGLCVWEGYVGKTKRIIISWGGVIAQGLLLVATYAATLLLPPNSGKISSQLTYIFIYTNFSIMVFNLVPIPGFDGATAWHIFDPLFTKIKNVFRRAKMRLELHKLDKIAERSEVNEKVAQELKDVVKRSQNKV